jgi:hypothetical protein
MPVPCAGPTTDRESRDPPRADQTVLPRQPSLARTRRFGSTARRSRRRGRRPSRRRGREAPMPFCFSDSNRSPDRVPNAMAKHLRAATNQPGPHQSIGLSTADVRRFLVPRRRRGCSELPTCLHRIRPMEASFGSRWGSLRFAIPTPWRAPLSPPTFRRPSQSARSHPRGARPSPRGRSELQRWSPPCA